MHRSMRCVLLVLVYMLCVCCIQGFLWDKEVDIVRSEWSSVVVVVRHVEYVGVIDNGTLDCTVPGFTKYRWTIVNKATKNGYAESYIMGSGDEKIPDSQSKLNIGGHDGFPLVNDLMVVSCEAMVGLHPYMQVIWAITRLHSPLGYPTDPRVCDFGGKTFETNCTWYQWSYKTDCYYDKGLDYSGGVDRAKHLKCKYWHMSDGNHKQSSLFAELMGIYDKGGHDYCRNVPVNPSCYLKNKNSASCRKNILTQPWCFTDDIPGEKPYKVHYCDVKECTSCIYGNGDGSFKLYPGKKFPKYLGRSIKTTKKSKDSQVLCLQGIGWEDNICRTSISIQTKSMDRPYVVTKTTPHCYVAKPGADVSDIHRVPHKNLELASCKFPQCTVRQVWFLFFNTYGKPFVVESNFEGIKIELVEGREEERIKFAAFGIHLTKGMKVGSEDGMGSYLGSFSFDLKRPPDKLSELIVKNVKKQFTGKYFLEYTFIEADPTIEQARYKVKFEIDVKKPTKLTLSPSTLKVCLKGNGKITANVQGYFSILDDSIQWKYGTSRSSIKTEISPENTRFELSADSKSLVIKGVTEGLWVMVEGRSYSGITAAVAHVTLKDQPLLKAVSPAVQYVLPGDDVTIMIETNQLQPIVWIYDAVVIKSLPDDPDMGFRRIARGNNVVTSLVISDVKDHHYGNYYVEAVLDGCKSVITFSIKHSSENPDFSNVETKRIARPVYFNRTGLWCTDELDPYAFYFSLEFQSISTIGALRNEPLTQSKAVEVQHYSIKYSTQKTIWKRITLSKNTSTIPYTLLGNKIKWFPAPITAKYLRVYPERLDSIACMKVRFFGCKGNSLDCEDINQIKDSIPLELLIGIPCGVAPLIAMIAYYFWQQRKRSAHEQKSQKISKRKRKRKEKKEERKSKRTRKKRDGRPKTQKKQEEDDVPKKKKKKHLTSEESSSFELDSEEEREIRRKAKLKVKKKEIEIQERLKLKRKLAKQRETERNESDEQQSDAVTNEDQGKQGEDDAQKKNRRKNDSRKRRKISESRRKGKRNSGKMAKRRNTDSELSISLTDSPSS